MDGCPKLFHCEMAKPTKERERPKVMTLDERFTLLMKRKKTNKRKSDRNGKGKQTKKGKLAPSAEELDRELDAYQGRENIAEKDDLDKDLDAYLANEKKE